MKKFIIRYWKVIIWCLVIFIFSSIPNIPKAEIIWWDFIFKKSAHIGEYAILFYLLYQAGEQKGNWTTPFLFGLFFALSDEYHQSFTFGRGSRLTDVGFDSFGMLLAFLKLSKFS